MSRSISALTLSILFFLTFAIFASAAPTNVTCGELEVVKSSPGEVEDVPVAVDDSTDDDLGVVNLDDINTLATVRSGTVRHFSNRCSMD